MKPTDLVKGRTYRIVGKFGSVMGRFVERKSRKVSVFIVDEYKGLNGPADDGSVQLSDYDISRKVLEKE